MRAPCFQQAGWASNPSLLHQAPLILRGPCSAGKPQQLLNKHLLKYKLLCKEQKSWLCTQLTEKGTPELPPRHNPQPVNQTLNPKSWDSKERGGRWEEPQVPGDNFWDIEAQFPGKGRPQTGYSLHLTWELSTSLYHCITGTFLSLWYPRPCCKRDTIYLVH